MKATIDKMDGRSSNITAETIEQLRQLMPGVFTEDKVDFEKLQAVLGEHIEKDNEKYSFNWKGKFDAMRLAQLQSTGTLLPAIAESKDWGTTNNLYIEGDNLEVLKLMQKSYKNSVKMIYIDVPYNTGSEFIYEDDFSDNIANYKNITGQKQKSNAETSGRFHTNWLNMMYPRLRLSRTLLKPEGVIFISIDDHEQANLKKLCDEVFGEDNFIACIIWERAFAPKNDAKYLSESHDYVLMYAKNKTEFTVGRLDRTQESVERYKNADNDPRGEWTSGDLSVKTYSAAYDYPIKTPSGREVRPPHGACWRVSKERFAELVADNRIWFGEGGDNVPRLKRFLSEVQEGMTPTTLFFHKDVGHNQEGRQELKDLFGGKGYFDGPKPVRLLSRLMKISNLDKDAIVMDFFSGSGTTAHAVMQANAEDSGSRRFIIVQLPEMIDEDTEAYKDGYRNICDIGKRRVHLAGEKIKNANPMLTQNLDVGFKVFKLDISNLKKWNSAPTTDEAEIQQRIKDNIFYLEDGRKDIDVVYEILLKYGLKLTTPVTTQKFGNTEIHIAEDPQYKLAICLTPNTPLADIEKMVDGDFGVYIFVDRCFADANVLINAQELLRKKEKKLLLF